MEQNSYEAEGWKELGGRKEEEGNARKVWGETQTGRGMTGNLYLSGGVRAPIPTEGSGRRER